MEDRIATPVDGGTESVLPAAVAHSTVKMKSAGKSDLHSEKEEDSDSPFAVSVTDVYEGPLDLLLDLIRKQDIDIYDLSLIHIFLFCIATSAAKSRLCTKNLIAARKRCATQNQANLFANA